MPNFSMFNPFSPSHSAAMPTIINTPCSPFNMQMADMANYANVGSPMYNSATPGPYPNPLPLSPVSLTPPMFPNTWMIPSPQPNVDQFHYPNISVPNPTAVYKNSGSWNPLTNNNVNDVEVQQQAMMPPPYQQMPSEGRSVVLNQLLNMSSQASSGYQSNFTGSSVSLDAQNTSGGEASNGSNVVSPSVSPISKTQSPVPPNEVDRTQQDLANIMSDVPLSDRRAVGCEKKTLETLNKMSPLSDYRKMKAEATKAMRETIGSGYRVPNLRWAGHYFSHTSPGSMNLKDINDNDVVVTPEKVWNKSELVRPNIASPQGTTPGSSPAGRPPSRAPTPAPSASPPKSKSCRYEELYNLLNDSGLNKYIDLFRKHELDMSTFLSLNEADLTEIGVTAFGARRKMLMIIADLQRQASGYNGSAAPGAERKLLKSPQYNAAALAQDKW